VSDIRKKRLRPGLLFVVLSGLLLAACSSGGNTPTGQPSGTGTPTQDYAAHALNLTGAAFPSSWKSESSTGGKNVVRSALNSCVAKQSNAPTPATAAVSSNFLDGTSGREVGSQVQIFDSPGEANQAAAIAGSSAVSSCLGPQVQSDLGSTLTANEKVTNVVASAIPPALASVPHAFGQRVVATISYPQKDGKQGSTDVYIDVHGFPHGAALVEAEFESPGSAPPADLSASTMTTLLKAAKGG
jgi:hypothetical protein